MRTNAKEFNGKYVESVVSEGNTYLNKALSEFQHAAKEAKKLGLIKKQEKIESLVKALMALERD